MTKKAWSARNKQDLIIEVWEYLDCESVGARELEEIQKALSEKFGPGGLASPAAIARAVADEGAVLRHPEVFECDVNWRKEHLKKQEFQNELDFGDLSAAFDSVVKLEEKRLQLQLDEDANGLKELREIVMAVRKDLAMRGRSQIFEVAMREQLKEISEWLTVWLQSPELFSDWLDLRRQSPEFVKKFP
ncbi:MAG TPA: hypothetical protein VGO68_09685 [Pyrinomonadaceae bacterium]|jgi:hypothetical protein|nr:hypothetical protein [Pyrinomonadaceae bacterium]